MEESALEAMALALAGAQLDSFRAEGAMMIAGMMPTEAPEIADLLRQRGLTLGLAESATGGLISSWLTGIPGSSVFFKGAVVAYDNQVKRLLLGVRQSTLDAYGAVSHEVAEEMARGVVDRLDVDLALADTGIAGPAGATPSKPVGLFYIALATRQTVTIEKRLFTGDRLAIRFEAAIAALHLLRRHILTSATPAAD